MYGAMNDGGEEGEDFINVMEYTIIVYFPANV
jgi:hypothetical protein